jgi:CheY-like chemotaxis protein
MTNDLAVATVSRTDATHGPDRRHRTELDLAAEQLRAITRFNDARRMAEAAAAAAARSREMRMDVARSLEVLRREHDAVVARAHEQLRVTGSLLRGTPEQRVLIAHRNEWFVEKVAHALHDRGLRVVARVDNGADAIGIAVAEQPDLVVVEDTLAMVPGEQVVRDVRSYCPQTLVAAQAAHGDRVAPLLQAGAAAVFTRRVPPLDVVRDVLALLEAA